MVSLDLGEFASVRGEVQVVDGFLENDISHRAAFDEYIGTDIRNQRPSRLVVGMRASMGIAFEEITDHRAQ